MTAELNRLDAAPAWHLEPVVCPFCRGRNSRAWGHENGFSAVKCRDCGIVYVTPRPSAAAISEANTIGEHRTETGSLDVQFRRSASKVAAYRGLVRSLFRAELAAGRLASWLDVGAGYGELVEAVRSLLPPGSVVEGIEPMASKAYEAQARGLPVRCALLSDVDRRFQVVSLINVLSHLPDVDAFLRDIADRIEDGGTLLLETGNAGDLQSADAYPDLLYLPDHLIFAGIAHVEDFLMRAGFTNVSARRLRRDGLGFVLKTCAKRLLGRKVKLVLPYRSPFRTVFFKARLSGRAEAAPLGHGPVGASEAWTTRVAGRQS